VLHILNTFEDPDEGDDCPQLLVGTQASVKDGQFLLNSKKRNVQTVDYNAFVPFTYGEEEGQSFLCVLVIDKFYLARTCLRDAKRGLEGSQGMPMRMLCVYPRSLSHV